MSNQLTSHTWQFGWCVVFILKCTVVAMMSLLLASACDNFAHTQIKKKKRTARLVQEERHHLNLKNNALRSSRGDQQRTVAKMQSG